MNKENKRIVFLGTPAFAVASLQALVENKYNVVAVVTAPDKPAGRGMHLQPSAVKQYAIDNNIPVLQPEKLKNEDFLTQLKSYNADVQVVVAFRMLPEQVWNMPPLGTINVHASLLPNYRGAAPINWAVINGETQTGVTTFKLQHDIDTGNILLQKKIDILPSQNVGDVYENLMQAGADLLVETIEKLLANSLVEIPQATIALGNIQHAPKIFTETCAIDFSKTCSQVHNLIRGLSPYPAAFTFLQNKKLKIFSATPVPQKHEMGIGAWHTVGKSFLQFACADGFINCTEIQLEGKKKMHISDFLRGNKL